MALIGGSEMGEGCYEEAYLRRSLDAANADIAILLAQVERLKRERAALIADRQGDASGRVLEVHRLFCSDLTELCKRYSLGVKAGGAETEGCMLLEDPLKDTEIFSPRWSDRFGGYLEIVREKEKEEG